MLLLANVLADTVVVTPMLVLPQILDHYDTDQAAWVSSSAMLAGAMLAPLFGKSADVHGKRRVLTAALLVAGGGGLICLLAPGLWVFVLGRMVQGAAVAGVFLTVALVQDLCTPKVAMTAVGAVTAGAGIVSLVVNVSVEQLVAQHGFRVVFLASAALAVVAVVLIRFLVPEPATRTAGRLDVAGAVLFGGGVTALLAFISFGGDIGWFSPGALALLAGGAAALAAWVRAAGRVPEPVIDIRNLDRALVFTLLVTVLGTGAVQSMDQLLSVIAQVPAERGLGYGFDATGSLSLLFGIPAIGIMAGGLLSGWVAARLDPSVALAGGVVAGTTGAVGMFAGASSFYGAISFAVLLNLCLGVLLVSGFTMAAVLAPPERQAVTASMVSVMSATGSVVMSFVGAAVLSATDVVVVGTVVNSAVGVYAYIGISAGALAIAVVLAWVLVAQRRRG
ncbi:MFS transporter [Lentzea guizhouensis]|uniref:MFS transporter n=1 Tax=Lentzea guizhouensis TaxID=1586287 RepID=UPI000AAA9721|nr:MFS transporter [Lentzea guizhouensis]